MILLPLTAILLIVLWGVQRVRQALRAEDARLIRIACLRATDDEQRASLDY